MLQSRRSPSRWPALTALAGLLVAHGACSLRSLDYLKNGQRPDAAIIDSRGADMEIRPRFDATVFDAVSLDSRAQGGTGEISGTGGTDGMTGDNADDGEPDDGAAPEVDSNLRATDDAADDVPVTVAEDSGADETPEVETSGGDGDSVEGEGGTLDAVHGTGYDLGTGGMTGTGGTGGTGGSGGNSDARGGTGGSPGADAGAADASNSCAGLSVGGICWYLGAQGLSCQQVCASHGQPAPTALTYVGSTHQGGGILKCAILLGLLGVSGTPQTGTRTDGLGLGCHLLVQDGGTYWLSSPDFSVTATGATARLVCGCAQ